jgi:Tol biopolymer transport system component
LRDIGDLRFEVDEAEEGPSRLVPDVSPHRRHLVWANVSVLIVLAAAAVVWWVSRPGAQATEVHVELTTPSTRDPISLAIAPDGRSLVFAASSGERQQLWLRALDSSNAKPLAGTDAARFPFWSADGRSVGFFADGKLLRMDIEGGAATILANAALGQGGAWNRDGTILFAPAPASGLFQIQADGGTPVAVTTVAGPQQIGHSSPQFLPDARHFLYYVEGSSDVRGVYVGELGRKESNRVVDADAAAVFSSGHLLFVRQGMLYAQRFDAASLTLTGVPFVVGEQPAIQRPAAAISASDDGSIAYRTGASGDERAYIWFDHSGKEVGRLSAPPGSVRTAPEFAPDGRTVVLHTVSGNADLWSVDVARGAFKRLTEAPADDILPIWSPDGARVAFSSTRRGNLDLYVKSASGTGTEDLLIESSGTQALSDWSPDGQLLAYTSGDPQTGFDIWMLPIDGNRKAFPVVQTKFNERLAQFSPDGKWIAYESNESGRYEIYLQRFSAADGKTGGAIPVSTNGGAQVRWRPDGKGLYYLAFDDRLMTVPITVAPDQTLQLGRPAALFTTRVADGAQQPFPRYQYNVSPDGQRFLMNTLTDGGTSPLILILNWRPES